MFVVSAQQFQAGKKTHPRYRLAATAGSLRSLMNYMPFIIFRVKTYCLILSYYIFRQTRSQDRPGNVKQNITSSGSKTS